MSASTSNERHDQILFDLVRQGDPSAFREIYDCYWERLFAYTYNRLQSREGSEEVVQDVFASLWAKRESIVINASLSAYLFGATKHRLLNELRSARVRKRYAADYSAFMEHLYDNSNVEEQDLNDLKDSIEASVSRLPKQCQAIFRLSRQHHVPNYSIAERMNISTKTVENYLTQALKYIRTSLGGQ